jgi:hypothetical protein
MKVTNDLRKAETRIGYLSNGSHPRNWLRDSSFNVVNKLRAGRPGFDSRQGQGIFPFTTTSRPALGPTQSRVQWVGTGDSFTGGKAGWARS